MGRFRFKIGDTEITNVVESADLSDDIDQTARMCDFTVAYNPRDEYMPNPKIELGDVLFIYSEEEAAAQSAEAEAEKQEDDGEIFRGVVFFRERTTSDMTMRFTAYDYSIYLTKSKMTRNFKKIAAQSVVEQVCNELGVAVGEIAPIGAQVDFVADSKTGIEIIREALELARVKTGKTFIPLMRREKLCIVEKGTMVEEYTATDQTNIERTTYSESIEEMINQVLIVDKDGNTIGSVANEEERAAYGLLQDIYKVDDKKDTQSSARAKLKGIARACSLSGLGDVRCITGYAITIKDEQLKGKFFIKSDRHSIRNAIHTMELELEFLEMVENEQQESGA